MVSSIVDKIKVLAVVVMLCGVALSMYFAINTWSAAYDSSKQIDSYEESIKQYEMFYGEGVGQEMLDEARGQVRDQYLNGAITLVIGIVGTLGSVYLLRAYGELVSNTSQIAYENERAAKQISDALASRADT